MAQETIILTKEEIKERNAQMALMFAQGKGIFEIGESFGLTKQRTSQILRSMGISPKERRTERKEDKVVLKYKEKAEKYHQTAKNLREQLNRQCLQVLNLETQITARDKKIEKVANFVEELRTLQLRIASLSSLIVRRDKKIKELRKENKRLTLLVSQENDTITE